MTPTFQGEVMLASWMESHNSGARVSFWLHDSADLEVFKGLTVKKGNVAGHRFAMVLVEIGDDEQPNPGTDAAILAAAKGGDLARLAGILCAAEPFRQWFWTQKWFRHPDNSQILGAVCDEEETADVVRLVCGVTSRAELDHNTEAAERFHNLIRKPYNNFISEATNARSSHGG